MPGLNVTSGPGQATEVVCLMNMITPQELEDEDEYEGMYSTVHCYGTQLSLLNAWDLLIFI